MEKDIVKVWNMAHLDKAEIEIKNKTNDGLERYNRHFNGIVPVSHPNLLVFVQALRKETDDVVQRNETVRKGQEVISEKTKKRKVSTIEILEEFESFL